MVSLQGPFADPAPAHNQLRDAPLVRAVAQVRFPDLTKVRIHGEKIADAVADALSDAYPVMESGKEVSINITPEGVSQQEGDQTWRLSSGDDNWQVTFGRNFISIDTTAYVSREDFANRMAEAWEAFTKQVPPPRIDRIGVRYLNHVTDRFVLDDLAAHLQPYIVGVAAATEGAELIRGLSEAQYTLEDGSGFNARWGLLQSGVQIDERSTPVDHHSWILDMDAFRIGGLAGGMRDAVAGLASRGYQFFRWAVTDQFLITMGGDHDVR